MNSPEKDVEVAIGAEDTWALPVPDGSVLGEQWSWRTNQAGVGHSPQP
jgi:hypothetical protein